MIAVSSLWVDPFIMQYSSTYLVILFILKSTLSGIKLVTPVLSLWFAGYNFSIWLLQLAYEFIFKVFIL